VFKVCCYNFNKSAAGLSVIKKVLNYKTIIVSLIILQCIVAFVINLNTQREINTFIAHKTKSSEVEYQAVYTKVKEQSNMIFQGNINTPTVISIFKNANTSDKKQQNIIREALYKHLLPNYKKFNKLIYLEQLHFHLPDNKSFLRMHKPNKYGDDLTGIRATVEYVNKFKKPINGFEEGRVKNGFRFVYPLFDEENKYLGSVEASFTIEAFNQALNNELHLSLFIIRKSIVHKNSWPESIIQNYSEVEISPLFLLNTTQYNDNALAKVANIRKHITSEIKLSFSKSILTENAFSLPLPLAGKTYLLTFLPIKNSVLNKVTSYVVLITQDSVLNDINKEFWILQGIGFLFVLILFYFFYRNQINHEKLLQSKLKYSTIINNVKDYYFIYSHDANGIFTYVSHSITDVLGYSTEHFLKHYSTYLTDDPINNLVEEKTNKTIDGQPQQPYIISIYHKNGDIKYIEVNESLSTDVNGNFISVEGVARDVTQTYTITKKLEKSENRYRTLFEGNKIVELIINPSDGRIVDANKKASEYYGYSSDEFKQMKISDINIMSPDDIQVEMRQAKKENRDEFYFKHKLASGETREVQVNSGPIEVDNTILLYSTIYDITEKKSLEKDLKNSYRLLHKLTENIPGAIFQYRLYPDGKATFPHISNGIKELYELSPEDLFHDATPGFNRIYKGDLERVASSIIDSAETMEEWVIEYRVNLPKKGLRWIEGHSKPEKLKDGSILWHGYIYDITEEKIKEENLLLSNKRFEHAEHAGNVGSWEYDIETQNYWGSLQSKVIFGMPTETITFSAEIVESCMTERKRIHQALVDLIEKGTEYNLEYEINPFDGSSPKIISSIATVEFDDAKKPVKVTGFIQDITERSKLQKELEAEKNRFSLAVEGSKDGLWDWDLQTNELVFGERFEVMLGYTPGTLENNVNTWMNLLHPDDIVPANNVIQEYFDKKGEGTYENTFRFLAKDGSWRWMLGRGKAEFDEDGTPLRFVGFNTDITEQKEYQDKLDHTAKHDLLTNLPNRFLLSELLTHEMKVTKRNNKQLALLFIDLDGFKEVNDIYGHDAGDEVLTVVASRMNNVVRESDIVSRLGGDEFVIVITDINKSEELIPLFNRLLSDLSSTIKYNKHNMHVSASIGVSLYPQVMDIGNEVLLRQADQAMYDAKTSGKNQYKFFNIEASDEIIQNQKNISNLRNAISENQFVLHYQPKVNMKTNTVVGLEALLRWNHPEKGLLFPNDFLPLVEHDANLMIELGRWVFNNAFSALEFWHLKGLNISLSINVSSHEVQQAGFSLYLKTLLDKHQGIKPNTVEIELLETAAFDNFELTSKILEECQDLGVSIAIDDFGTGYASLHYLKKLPMNTLKIDKSFVIDLLHTSSSLSIIESSVGLARAFNVDLVAEGVESEEHGIILLQLGCTIAQGYVVEKAMPAENVIEWIASYKGFSSWSTIERLNDEQREILYVSIEYRSWIFSFENFIKNNNDNPPQLDATSCQLGRWINNCSAQEYLSHPEFKALQTLHTELHDYAGKLLLSNENERLAGIEKIKDFRHEILKKLDSLMCHCR
jgi:diguanylate cyclase (GGDEF)-like protein/PAS domain S-box-containing protein